MGPRKRRPRNGPGQTLTVVRKRPKEQVVWVTQTGRPVLAGALHGRAINTYRVDGILYDTQVSENIRYLYPAIVSRIKVMAKMNIAEKRLPQDGRIRPRWRTGTSTSGFPRFRLPLAREWC